MLYTTVMNRAALHLEALQLLLPSAFYFYEMEILFCEYKRELEAHQNNKIHKTGHAWALASAWQLLNVELSFFMLLQG